jgi:hypothetical protein
MLFEDNIDFRPVARAPEKYPCFRFRLVNGAVYFTNYKLLKQTSGCKRVESGGQTAVDRIGDSGIKKIKFWMFGGD